MKANRLVNDQLVGNVRIVDIRDRGQTWKSDRRTKRLTFRCSDNPFKCLVPTRFADLHTMTVAAAINDQFVLEGLIPIVIRNYLRNYVNFALAT